MELLKGESAAKMAFLPFIKIDILVDRSTVKAIGLELSDELQAEAARGWSEPGSSRRAATWIVPSRPGHGGGCATAREPQR